MRRAALILLAASSLGGCASAPPPAPPPLASKVCAAATQIAGSPLPDRAKEPPASDPAPAAVPLPAAPFAPELPGPPTKREPEPSVSAPPDEDAFGIASYYARRFEGRRTASGVIYDPGKLTAAHQSLPFGTRVRVVNLRNGREVVVTVTDRCRKRTFPFIDLSRAAAKELGFFGKGITRVQITVLGDERPPSADAGG
jgi:rare lipoprotein A